MSCLTSFLVRLNNNLNIEGKNNNNLVSNTQAAIDAYYSNDPLVNGSDIIQGEISRIEKQEIEKNILLSNFTGFLFSIIVAVIFCIVAIMSSMTYDLFGNILVLSFSLFICLFCLYVILRTPPAQIEKIIIEDIDSIQLIKENQLNAAFCAY